MKGCRPAAPAAPAPNSVRFRTAHAELRSSHGHRSRLRLPGSRARDHRDPVVAPAVAVTAFASIGAGAIHAAAIGVHSEHRSAVVAFTILAVAQIGFGVLALLEPTRAALFVGAGVNVAAMGGWILAKTSGIGFIDGLDVTEDPQWADSIAFGLATVSVIAAIGAATWWRSSASASARPRSRWSSS